MAIQYEGHLRVFVCLYTHVHTQVIILVGGIPFVWAVAGSTLKYFNLSEEYEVGRLWRWECGRGLDVCGWVGVVCV